MQTITYLAEIGAPLLGAAVTIAACYFVGLILLGWLGVGNQLSRLERFPLAFLSGAAILHLGVFGLFALHVAYEPVVVMLAAAPVVYCVWRRPGIGHQQSIALPRGIVIATALVFLPYIVLYFFEAWGPEIAPDGYHLGVIARYLRSGGFERITTSYHAALSMGVEMVFVPALLIGGRTAAALVHFVFGIALGWAILAYGQRIGRAWAGMAAVGLTLLSPVVGKDTTMAYVDAAVAGVVFAAFYWIELWDESRNGRILVAVGLMAGFAFSAKYTAIPILLYAVVFVAIRSKKWRPALVVTGAAAVMMLPWMVRNWVWYDNPVARAANAVFRNPYFHVLWEQEIGESMRSYGIHTLHEWVTELTITGGRTGGLIGPVFLLAPIALLSLRYAAGRRLLMVLLVVLTTYPAHITARFFITALPFLSLSLALALGERRTILVLLVAVHAVLSWPTVLPRYANPSAWMLGKLHTSPALRPAQRERYLREKSPVYESSRMIEQYVPEGQAVLAENGVAEEYTTREVRVTFESASNELLADSFYMGFDVSTQARRVQIFRFPRQAVRGLRVVQTAQVEGPEQWSVHEIRFFHDGTEISPSRDWRLSARPNSWDAGLAFDRSYVTRWRSWEGAKPGMYVAASFMSDTEVDEVRVETSVDCSHARLRLEAESAGGIWTSMGGAPQEDSLPELPSIRAEATRQLLRSGVQYVLLRQGEWGAEDVRARAEEWRLMRVAEHEGEVLYKVLP